MLAKILKLETCVECHFCCTFNREEQVFTPIFSMEKLQALQTKHSGIVIKTIGHCATYDLSGFYRTSAADEYVPCPFLDLEHGCKLSDTDKPIGCKIWPLSCMAKDGEFLIGLAPSCPAVNDEFLSGLRDLLYQDGLGERIINEHRLMPDMADPFDESFRVLYRAPMGKR